MAVQRRGQDSAWVEARLVRLALLAQAACLFFYLGFQLSLAEFKPLLHTLLHPASSNSSLTDANRSGTGCSGGAAWAGPITPLFTAEEWPENYHLYADRNGTTVGCRRALWDGRPWWGNSSSSSGGAELIGTSIAQRDIYRHQHPESCKGAKFFVNRPHMTGIGSQLHIMGAFLAVAMDMGRVYMEARGADTLYTNGSYCKAHDTMDKCYFERFSSCKLEDAAWDPAGTPLWVPGADQGGDRTIWANGTLEWQSKESRVVPRQFEGLLGASRLASHMHFIWWRAQAAAYMVRPNRRTLKQLKEMRGRYFRDQQILPGTIAVHVRHGDKWIETGLIEDLVYWDRAQTLQRDHSALLRKTVFISTEDEHTVAWFANTTQHEGWHARWATTPRKPGSSIGEMDWHNRVTTIDMTTQVGPTNEFLWSLLNLQLALEADAWVGTMTSNWCRLVDELRSTVRCKAHLPYLDAQQDDPPLDFGWR